MKMQKKNNLREKFQKCFDTFRSENALKNREISAHKTQKND